MSKPKAVLFDLDGTLVDTAPDFVLAANALRAAHQLKPIAAETISPVVSNGAAAVTLAAIDENQYPDLHRKIGFEALRQQLLAHYNDALGKSSVIYPGLNETLLALEKNDIPWGVVTNKPVLYAKPLLEKLNLATRCGSLICPEHVERAKPDPAGIFLGIQALQQTNPALTPETCLYVGDHQRDIDAAKNANCISIAVSYGYIESVSEPEQWDADYLVETSAVLAQLLDALLL